MKTDVRNNFTEPLNDDNQNHFDLESSICEIKTNNVKIPPNQLNNNFIFENSDKLVKERFRSNELEISGDVNNTATKILPDNKHTEINSNYLCYDTKENDVITLCKLSHNDRVSNPCNKPSHYYSEGSEMPDVVILNPCFKDINGYKIGPMDEMLHFHSLDTISRKIILNDTITNALSSSDQLINLRELSNAISYNRKFDACNCQSLYDELIFPCAKPTLENVIRNSCAKEAHFVLGIPKKKPKFPNKPPEIKIDSSFCKSEDYGKEKSKYILPIPQTSEDTKLFFDPKQAKSLQPKEESSDNFDKSEYLKFKQIACSSDEFKLNILFDGFIKKRPPGLQNRSSSFPQTEDEIAFQNKSVSNSKCPERKYSHPTMSFQSFSEGNNKNGSLSEKRDNTIKVLPFKPIQQYAFNNKTDSLRKPLETSSSKFEIDVPKQSSCSSKPASKRRQEFGLRRCSAPVTDAYTTKCKNTTGMSDKPEALPDCSTANKHSTFVSEAINCDACYMLKTADREKGNYINHYNRTYPQGLAAIHRRSTIGPETMRYDLSHLSKINQFKLGMTYQKDNDSSHLLKCRNKIFCDGFKSLEQMSSLSTSIDSSNGLSSDSSSDSSSFTSSSSWSISSSSSSDSSDYC